MNELIEFGIIASSLGGDPIDVGPGAVNLSGTNVSGYTWISAENPANDTGTIKSVELWFATTGGGVKVGTFSRSGSVLTLRDSATIGTVTAGSKQTFSGLSISIVTGDHIGMYFTSGTMEWDSGGGGVYWKIGDQFGAGPQTYTHNTSADMAIYGIGLT